MGNKRKVVHPNSENSKRWHTQQEKILKTWGEQAACYRYMHFKAYQKYKKLSMRFTLPIIIISTVTGTANFAQETFPNSWKSLAPVVIGGLNLTAAILTTTLQFLKINELMESHRVSSILYGKLSRTIRLQLTLPTPERYHDVRDFVETCGNEFDRLIEQSPPVPSHILIEFEKNFSIQIESKKGFLNSVNKINKMQDIIKPEIITISPIIPYDNIREEQIIKDVVDQFKRKKSLNTADEVSLENVVVEKSSVKEIAKSFERNNSV